METFFNDRCAAESLAEIVSVKDTTVNAKVKSPSFFGIIRHVPNEISAEELCAMIPNCLKVIQMGNTRSFKIQFDNKLQLSSVMDSPPIFGYKRVSVKEFKFKPMQCYNCQSFGHAAKSCTSPPICSRCGGSHLNSRANPCQNAQKCALYI
jgi:hypothetical protein